MMTVSGRVVCGITYLSLQSLPSLTVLHLAFSYECSSSYSVHLLKRADIYHSFIVSLLCHIFAELFICRSVDFHRLLETMLLVILNNAGFEQGGLQTMHNENQAYSGLCKFGTIYFRNHAVWEHCVLELRIFQFR